MDSNINFFYELDGFNLQNESKLTVWLNDSSSNEGQKIGEISVIFCDDEYLLDINKQYLQHDYYTDIITFDYSEDGGNLKGDLFISIDRAYDNADDLKVDRIHEVYRLLIHGLLHLLGYQDKEVDDKKLMTSKEDYYLNKLK